MRDIKKAVDFYNKHYSHKKTRKGKFYSNDLQRIYDISNDKTWGCIHNGLKAGFIIGYQLAKREARESMKKKLK